MLLLIVVWAFADNLVLAWMCNPGDSITYLCSVLPSRSMVYLYTSSYAVQTIADLHSYTMDQMKDAIIPINAVLNRCCHVKDVIPMDGSVEHVVRCSTN